MWILVFFSCKCWILYYSLFCFLCSGDSFSGVLFSFSNLIFSLINPKYLSAFHSFAYSLFSNNSSNCPMFIVIISSIIFLLLFFFLFLLIFLLIYNF